MKKQTKLEDGNIPNVSYEVCHFQMSEEKQIALAMLEKELGIDLIILLKAVRDGVWVRHCYNTPCESIDYMPFRVDYWKDYIEGKEGWLICGFEPRDYGKTWALTKGELE